MCWTQDAPTPTPQDGAISQATFHRITGGISGSTDNSHAYFTDAACAVRSYNVDGAGSETISIVAGAPDTCQHDMSQGTFARPTGVVVDKHDPNFLYVADSGAGSIVKVHKDDGTTTRVVGTGVNGQLGSIVDPESPSSSVLKSCTGIALRGRSLYTVALASDGAYKALIVKYNIATGVRPCAPPIDHASPVYHGGTPLPAPRL